MSEWYDCPHCHATRESGCACTNPNCPDGIPEEHKGPTPAEKLIGEVIGVSSRLAALRSLLKDHPQMLPDINSYLELSYAIGMVEGEVRHMERLMSTTHAAWLKAKHPHLAPERDPKDWEKAEARVQEYMAKHGPPSDVVLAATDKTP